MKRLSTLTLLGVLVCTFNNHSLGQDSFRNKFPQRPLRQEADPSDIQLQSWNEFDLQHQSWLIRWDKRTGAPATMYGNPVRIDGGNPSEIAARFIDMIEKAIGIVDDNNQLFLKEIIDTGRSKHVVFTQYYDGVHVEGGTYSVHMNNANEIYCVNGTFYPNVQINMIRPTISLNYACVVAANNLSTQIEYRRESTGDLVILPYGEEYILCWKVTIFPSSTLGDWTYYLSASDGSILSGYSTRDNLLVTSPVNNDMPVSDESETETSNSPKYVTGEGIVYDSHPNAGNRVFRDLTDLNSPGYYLDGLRVEVLNWQESEAYNEDSEFYYEDSDKHFDEVMAYYHINRFLGEFMYDLGHQYASYPGNYVKLHAEVYRSYYWVGALALQDSLLWFGEGNGIDTLDSAKEAAILCHETQHLA